MARVRVSQRGRYGILGFIAAACLALTAAPAIAAPTSPTAHVSVLHLRFARTRYGVAPQAVSGRYALYSAAGVGRSGYALFDDRTQTSQAVPAGCGSELGPFLGPPWLLFDCATQPQLYNLKNRRLRNLNCGGACVNTGVAAVQAIGSDWIEYNEDAFCNSNYSTCNAGYTFVEIPSGINRRVTLDASHYIDLNARSLLRPLCAPLVPTSYGEWTFYGSHGVGENSQGLFVQRCGSNLQTELIDNVPGSPVTAPQGNQHAIFSCKDNTGQYEGLFLPSLRPFSFTLPRKPKAGCSAALGDDEIYVGAWRARFPSH